MYKGIMKKSRRSTIWNYLWISSISLSCLISIPAGAHGAANENNFAIYITGLGGSHRFKTDFRGAVRSLSTLLEKNGYNPAKGLHFGEDPEESMNSFEGTAENMQSELSRIAASGVTYDNLFIFVAGHAHGRDYEAVFHLPGPDLTYEKLIALLKPIKSKKMVMVVAAPQGQAWIESFSGEGKTIIAGGGLREFDFIPAAFLRFFPNMFRAAESKEDPQSDGFSTLADVFVQTQKRVQQWYATNGLRYTEIALLDANGDGKGSTLIEGGLASVVEDSALGSVKTPEDQAKGIASATLPFKKWVPENAVPAIVVNLDLPDAVEARKVIFKVSQGGGHGR